MAVNGHGDSYLEAREALENCKRDFLENWIEAGVEIPEPQRKNVLGNKEIYLKELAAVGI